MSLRPKPAAVNDKTRGLSVWQVWAARLQLCHKETAEPEFHKPFFGKGLRKQPAHMGLWHIICTLILVMVAMPSQFDEVNVLASGANWAWPLALRDIFQPRGVNLLVADTPADFLNIIRRKRIHTAIIDTDPEKAGGLATIKVIRMNYPLLPCLLLTKAASELLLETALRLDVFSVLEKPVKMPILLQLLDRMFTKKYNSDIFAENKM